MQRVKFTSAQLKRFGRSVKKGGFAKIEFSLTQAICQSMGWGEMQDWQHGANLDGDMAASSFEIIPKENENKKHAVQLGVARVAGFTATRREIEGERGKGTRWTVQFDVSFQDGTGCSQLEGFMISCDKAEVRVSYEKQPVQEEIPGTGEQEDDAQEDLIEEE
jgi:hypothetical protein